MDVENKEYHQIRFGVVPLMLVTSTMLIYIVKFYFLHGGYFGFDDIEYTMLANEWSKGNFPHEKDIYHYRYGLLAPLALMYKIFGFGDFANLMTSLIPFLLLVWLMLYMLKEQSNKAKVIAVSTMIFMPLYLMYMEKPMPDIILSLGFGLSFFSYFDLKFQLGKFTYHYVIWTLGMFITFLSKEIVLVFYPYFVFLALYDLFSGRFRRFWIMNIVLVIIGLIVYFTQQYLVAGHPLARLDAISNSQYHSYCSYHELPISDLIQRLFITQWQQFFNQAFLLPLVFLPLMQNNKDEKIKFLLLSSVGLLLLANFMTINYTAYQPLCADARHYIYVLPIIVLWMTYLLVGTQDIDRTMAMKIVGLSLFMGSINFFLKGEHSMFVYLLLIIGIYTWWRNKHKYFYVFWIIAMLSFIVKSGVYDFKNNYKMQKSVNQSINLTTQGKKWVVTDHMNARLGDYHYQFDKERIEFISFKEMGTIHLKDEDETYYCDNGFTRYMAGVNWNDLPDFAKTANDSLKMHYSKNKNVMYYLPKSYFVFNN